MLEKYDAPMWRRRFYETCGYLAFRDSFSGGDVINARLRYGKPVDEPLARRIRKETPTPINKATLWSAIAAPKEAFYELNEWRRFGARGDELYEEALLGFLGNQQVNEYLSGAQIKKAKVEATHELKARGFFPDPIPSLETPHLALPDDFYAPPAETGGTWPRFSG